MLTGEAKWPNLAAYYQLENNVGDELMTIDGKWYAHTMLRDNPEYNFMSGMSWIYRRDWAKKLNLYQEDDIYTWDEWVELNKAFIEQDPGENGAGKTIGMGTELFYFPNAFGVYQTSNQYGYGAFSPKDGKYEWTAARPETACWWPRTCMTRASSGRTILWARLPTKATRPA